MRVAGSGHFCRIIPTPRFFPKKGKNVHFIFFYIYYSCVKEREIEKRIVHVHFQTCTITCTLPEKRALKTTNVHY